MGLPSLQDYLAVKQIHKFFMICLLNPTPVPHALGLSPFVLSSLRSVTFKSKVCRRSDTVPRFPCIFWSMSCNRVSNFLIVICILLGPDAMVRGYDEIGVSNIYLKLCSCAPILWCHPSRAMWI